MTSNAVSAVDEVSALNIGAAIRDGLSLKPVEVVALLHNACEQLEAGAAAALVRSVDDLRVTDRGTVILPRLALVEPPRATVATLLEQMLPARSEGADGVPPALRSLPARLRDSGHTPGLELRDLLTILRWHLPTDSAEVLRDLVARARSGAPDLEPAAPIEMFLEEPLVSAPTVVSPVSPVSPPTVVSPVSPPIAAAPARASHWRFATAAAAAVFAIGASGFAGYRVTSDRVNSTTSTAAAAIEPRPGRITARPAATRTASIAEPQKAGPHMVDLPVSGGAFSPSFSSGGDRLLFHAGRNNSGRLFQASLDSHGRASAVTPFLDERGRAYHARPSPDGHWVAFDSDRDGERGVYIASSDGARVSRVSGDGYAAAPSWSPDMQWLAFVRAEPSDPKVWNLWLRDVATGSLTRESQFRKGQVWAASWFPDARSLCYSHEDRLIISDPGSGSTRTFASPIAGRMIRTPAVSPDGTRIVFQVYRDGAWLLDVKTGAMRRILDDLAAEEFAWAPDGNRIAYHSRRDGQWRIWMLSL